MIWAMDHHGGRIKASPNKEGYCSLCNEELIPKCGSVKIWHWSHKINTDCDDWYELESEWHIKWKNEFPKEGQEVKVENHFADIKTKEGLVIELQNSPLSAETIHEREQHYKRMIWVLNGETLAKGLEIRKKITCYGFKWKHFPKSWLEAEADIYIDLEWGLLKIGKIYENSITYENNNGDKVTKIYPISGWGKLISKEEFLKRFR